MRLKRNLLLSSLIFLLACKSFDKVSSKSYEGKEFVTENGLKYTIHRAGTGERASDGSLVSVHYAGRLVNGEEFDNSYERGTPIRFTLGDGQVIKGWEEGIALLNVGDSATFTIPPYLGYGDKKMGNIPANSTLIFDVELIGVRELTEPWDVSEKDTIQIREGLQMIKLKDNPKGIQPTDGQVVSVHYSGYFKNLEKFDSSVDRGNPFSFPLGKGRVIKGWDYGIAELRTGEKARLIIAADLAYGKNGRGSIPPNATLLFDVELLEVN